MIYRERVPAYPLCLAVERLWFYSGLDARHSREKLLPNAAMELIVNLDDIPKKLYEGVSPRHKKFQRAWISGMQTKYIVIGVERGSSMIGAHFRTGGATALFKLPMAELADEVVELEALYGDEVSSLRDQLMEAGDPDGKLKILEEYLSRKAMARLPMKQNVRAAISALQRNSQLQVRDLAAHLGWSHKQLLSRFESSVGMRPKALARVFRFRQALLAIHAAATSPEWAGFALDCGYCDQAHLIHDFQAFTGTTPAAYYLARTPLPDYLVVD